MIKYIIAIIYLVFPIIAQASEECFVDIFDVGQGNCTLIRYIFLIEMNVHLLKGYC